MSSSIIIGKIIAWFCSWLPFANGTALPGLIALRLNPGLIKQLVEKNKLQSIIVTGTNGKTTTCRLLGEIFKFNHLNYIHNRSGSNLLRGIASTLINQSDIRGRLKSSLAIWEIDEAAITAAVKQLQPKIILFTNLSRDQLDRYGEIDSVLKLWQQSLQLLPKNSTVVINRLDHHLRQLRFSQVIYFGRKLSPGQYNLQNREAAKTVARLLDLKPAVVETALSQFRPAFGRGEEFEFNHKKITILLVKNPAGFNAVWQMLDDQNCLDRPLLIALNDLIADGTDVSWIWDVDFNYLKQRKTAIIITGTRNFDMALRLKYAGLEPNLMIIEPNLKKALAYSPNYILPTYTAMLALRKIIFKQKFD